MKILQQSAQDPRKRLEQRPAELAAFEPPRCERVVVRATDPKRPPPCVACITEGGHMSPHHAAFEVRDGATGHVVIYACDRSIPGVLSRSLVAR